MDSDGRIYRFMEWYGYNGTPDEGLRLEDSKIAEGRELKIRQFRERLKLPASDLEMPMMVVYQSCKHFIRTIPALAIDEDNPEDIDTEQEDHVYDDTCLICMAQPL